MKASAETSPQDTQGTPYADMAHDVIASDGQVGMHGRSNEDFDITKARSIIAVSPSVNQFVPISGGSRYEIINGKATVRNQMVAPGSHPNDAKAPFHTFSDAHQERAIALTTSLAEKRGQRKVEEARREEVKIAKEVLGRAGLPIPKNPKTQK